MTLILNPHMINQRSEGTVPVVKCGTKENAMKLLQYISSLLPTTASFVILGGGHNSGPVVCKRTVQLYDISIQISSFHSSDSRLHIHNCDPSTLQIMNIHQAQ
jgi:hypothetical protein